jgi:hypothetical protein
LPSCSAYTSSNLRNWLFATAEERNEAFGYSGQVLPRVQQNYNAAWKTTTCGPSQDVSQADQNYYFDMRTDPREKSVIGYLGMQPNLYNDNLLPVSTVVPMEYKSWEPFTTTANPVPRGTRVQFIPHAPVEVAPRQRESYWVADLNARIHERKLVTGAIENPYANFYARQAFMNLVAQNMRSPGDPYVQTINGPQELFCPCPKPPPVTDF